MIIAVASDCEDRLADQPQPPERHGESQPSTPPKRTVDVAHASDKPPLALRLTALMQIASQVGLTRRQRSQAEGGSRRPRSARASRVSCSAIAHAPRVVGRTICGAPDAAAPRTASRPRCSLCSPYVRAELCRAPSRRRASRMSSRPSSSWLQWAVHRRRGHSSPSM